MTDKRTASTVDSVTTIPRGADLTDAENDARDGVLFRFWIRAASYPGGWPNELLQAFEDHGPDPTDGNMQPQHYRAALMALAREKGVNLP